MNKKLYYMSIFFVVYLVASISFVYATTVNIRYQGVTYSTQQIEPSTFVDKQVILYKDEPFYNNIQVEINIKNASSRPIEKVYIFKCKRLDPISCSDLQPDEFSGNIVGKRYAWSEISEQDGSSLYSQVAHLLYLIKLNKETGEDVWVGFWDKIKRFDQTTFNNPPYGFSLGAVNLERTATIQTSTIERFIQDNQMLPFNPDWTSEAAFLESDSLQETRATKTEIEIPQFTGNENPSQTIRAIEKDYYFVFPQTNNGFANPLALTLNPTYVCGNGVKDSSLGETEQNCCYDFGCSQSGFYCDTAASACRQEGGISMSYADRPVLRITNCNIWNRLNVSVRVNNPPGDMVFVSREQNIGGYITSVSCTGGPETSYLYTCEISVPPQQNCGSGETEIGPNYLNFTIQFDDGPAKKTKKISTILPDITVGSFVSGDGICERSLGESEANSCYDCGCFSGYYCDAAGPGSASCRPDITSSDFFVSNVNPANFPFYNAQAGDSFSLNANINNRPQSLSIVGRACSFECSSETSCSASCFVDCEEIGPAQPNIYSSSCRVDFLIQNYNSQQTYRLSPTLNFTVIYNNGTSQITKTLSTRFNTITTGRNYPGDGVCGPAENSVNNCYDCGCGFGFYCDTKYRTGPTEGDTCKTLDNIQMLIQSVSETQLTDSSIEHELIVSVFMENRPSGMAVAPNCVFGGQNCAELNIDVSCEETPNSNPARYEAGCKIKIPKINYKQSAYYNPDLKRLVFSQNSIGLSVTFNNASGAITKDFAFPLPDITIEPIAVCGNGVVEPELGENPSTCCADADCGNPALFCYTGDNPNGQCISGDQIQLVIDTINDINGDDVSDVIDCKIFFVKEKCSHVPAVDITGHITRPPLDLKLESPAFTEIDGTQKNVENCWKTGSGLFCTILIPDFGTTQPQLIEKQLTLTIPISYSANGTIIVKNLSASTIVKINITKDQSLLTREEDLANLNKRISRLRNYKNIVLAIIAATAVFCTGVCVWDWVEGEKACFFCWLAWSCMTDFALNNYVIGVAQRLEGLKLERENLHNAIQGGDIEKASSIASDSGTNTGLFIAGLGAKTACLVLGFMALTSAAQTKNVRIIYIV